jgi:hypothetical protein
MLRKIVGRKKVVDGCRSAYNNKINKDNSDFMHAILYQQKMLSISTKPWKVETKDKNF